MSSRKNKDSFIDFTTELKRSDPDRPITEITDLYELGKAIGKIKRNTEALGVGLEHMNNKVIGIETNVTVIQTQMKDIRPQISRMRDDYNREVSVLKTKVENIDRNLAHDCFQSENIANMSEEQKVVKKEIFDVSKDVVVSKKAIEGLDKASEELSKGRLWIYGIVVTIVISILGVAGGWIATLSTLKSDVGHLSGEQTKIRQDISGLKKTTKTSSGRIENATRRVEIIGKELVKKEDNHELNRFCMEIKNMDIKSKRRLYRVIDEEELPCVWSKNNEM